MGDYWGVDTYSQTPPNLSACTGGIPGTLSNKFASLSSVIPNTFVTMDIHTCLQWTLLERLTSLEDSYCRPETLGRVIWLVHLPLWTLTSHMCWAVVQVSPTPRYFNFWYSMIEFQHLFPPFLSLALPSSSLLPALPPFLLPSSLLPFSLSPFFHSLFILLPSFHPLSIPLSFIPPPLFSFFLLCAHEDA